MAIFEDCGGFGGCIVSAVAAPVTKKLAFERSFKVGKEYPAELIQVAAFLNYSWTMLS